MSDRDGPVPSHEHIAETLPIGPSVRSEPRAVDPAPHPLSGSRYDVQRMLGAGGMGEVLLCQDAWLGRDVAMKVMRDAGALGSEGRARFLREARVQGQLEHPSVVPVYDIAMGTAGSPYFTMKRIQGLTLRTILDRLAAGDEATAQAYGRRKLLAALGQACLAVAFAHRRGVIHRDLKPENLMLGEFGEVYVLDWGVARPAGAEELDEAAPTSKRAPIALGDDGLPVTAVGSLVGTPGYMSPEQAKGEVEAISPRSDVYSLGCILFEVLALEPVHDARDIHALLLSTMTKVAPPPSSIAPDRDIPPELDRVCARALALDPAARYASARELADALERYMDGERDAELRRSLAGEHLRLARESLELAASGGDHAEEARARGMRELGRALALDPTSEDAMALVTRVVMAAPSELPPAAQAALKEVEIRDRAASARRTLLVYAMWIVFAPLLVWCGVKSWALTIAIDGAFIATALYALWMSSTGNVEPRYMRVSIIANFALTAFLSTICGPLFIVPGAACVVGAAFMVSIRPNATTRRMIAMMMAASIAVPLALEWSGLMPKSLVFEDGAIRILPRLAFFPALPAQVLLGMTALVQVINTVVLVGGAVESLMAAEKKNFALAYRLGQLLPAARPKAEPERAPAVCSI